MALPAALLRTLEHAVSERPSSGLATEQKKASQQGAHMPAVPSAGAKRRPPAKNKLPTKAKQKGQKRKADGEHRSQGPGYDEDGVDDDADEVQPQRGPGGQFQPGEACPAQHKLCLNIPYA
jgi:hypothetical protein